MPTTSHVLRSVSAVILLVGISLGFLAQQNQQAPPLFAVKPCTDDPLIEITEGTDSFSVQPCRVFSETYQEARQKFRTAAQQVQAELHALPVPVPNEEKAQEDDSTYTIDIAILHGGKQDNGLVVHTSGIHGVEGYAGSSIQISFLESIYPSLKKKRGEDLPTIVLVHAINPYGMAHYRRTNEHNVDLNRNALHPETLETISREGPYGVYAAYHQFSDVFNPQQAPNWLDFFVGLWFKALIPLVQNGFDALKAAMVTGQYYMPRGIFYGGNQLEPSLSSLWDFFQTHRSAFVTSGRPVTWIDVHTGLGKTGQDTILTNIKSTPDNFEDLMRTFFPGARIPQLSLEAQSAQKGYENAKGFAPSFFRRLFSSSSYLGLVQEFGTVPGVLVAHALILENQAHHHLSREVALEWAKVTTKRAFYVQTTEWRASILERGLRLLLQGIHRSSSTESEETLQQ